MPRSKKGSSAALLIILALGIFAVAFQHYWVKSHLPEVEAGLAQAKLDGPKLLEEISTPPEAKLIREIEHGIRHGGKGKWSGVPINATWLALYDAPGTHAVSDAWYKDHLRKVGWTLRVPRIPSEVQTEFYRDKWLLVVEHDAWFTGREPHARFHLRLEWDYRHDLAPSRWSPP
jgi:hypothetical protein